MHTTHEFPSTQTPIITEETTIAYSIHWATISGDLARVKELVEEEGAPMQLDNGCILLEEDDVEVPMAPAHYAASKPDALGRELAPNRTGDRAR